MTTISARLASRRTHRRAAGAPLDREERLVRLASRRDRLRAQTHHDVARFGQLR
ncbi:hypothetical protein GCM10023340_42540 [Nocardioides marinquilinus]|uniref:Uncharacterized protein n=1 Tax=Nocardioides marinquilinus TaxID=1210400 RepID=A0ABP9Q284_9ACTN